MASLKDVIAYIAGQYPHADELSNARLTKMVYLSDWRHALEHDRQITDIAWYFDNFGPFVWDVLETAREEPGLFSIEETTTVFGSEKTLIRLQDRGYKPFLEGTERDAIDHVLSVTRPLYFDAFIRLVYSTYPIVKSERYSNLDLLDLARRYREERLARSSS